jgi:hypothetical protein
LEFGMHSAS